MQHTTHVGDYNGTVVLWHGTLAPHRRGFAAGVEGIHWIYGHHTEDSEQGAALLAAYALTQQRA